MNNKVRRINIRREVSVSYYLDVMHCLPTDAMIVQQGMDFACGWWVLLVVHPAFSEITEMQNIPVLEPVIETRRPLLGLMWDRQDFVVGLKDPQDNRVLRPE